MAFAHAPALLAQPRHWAALAIAAALAGQGPALADVRPGDRRSSELILGGIAIDGELVKPTDGEISNPRIRFVLPANRAAEINLASSEFDTELKIFDSPEAREPLKSDDDSGGNNNSKITLINMEPREKTYYLGVSSWADEPGGFRLSAVRVDFVRPPPPGLLRLNTTNGGTLGPESPFDGNTERRFAEYTLQMSASPLGRVAVTAKSEPVDLQLEITRNGQPYLSDDDSGQGNDPLIIFKPTAGDTYTARVIGNFVKQAPYSIEAKTLPIPRTDRPSAVTLELGQTEPAPIHFAPDQPVLEIGNRAETITGRPYALARFAGHAGDRVEIRARSKEGKEQIGVQVGVDTAAGFAMIPASPTAPYISPRPRQFVTFQNDGLLDLLISAPPLFVGDVNVTVIKAPARPEVETSN